MFVYVRNVMARIHSGLSTHSFFYGCIFSSFLITLVIVGLAYYSYGIFGTDLLLGWDSPGYVWQANRVLSTGVIRAIEAWGYPGIYTQLLALIGYVCKNIFVVERVLPIVFYAILLYASSKLVYKITENTYIAGLSALLSALSLNFLRVFSDLHRNFMALSLSFVVFLLVPSLLREKVFLTKRYVVFILLLAVIACTHFETYFILLFSFMLYGLITANLKKLLKIALACVLPVIVLVILFPTYFFGYISSIIFFPRILSFSDVLLWIGGSWFLFIFVIVGVFYSFYKTTQRNDELSPLIFSWFCVSLVLVGLMWHSYTLAEFILRILFILPVPLYLALSMAALDELVVRLHLNQLTFLKIAKHTKHISASQISLFFMSLCLIMQSALVTCQRAGEYLNPYIPRSSYNKLLAVCDYCAQNGLSQPVVIFYGEPGFWYVSLYRNYIGVELGEHFAYYGKIEDLFRFIPSEPSIIYDPYYMGVEKYFSILYYTELLGNWSGAPPPMYWHEFYISDVQELKSHAIIVVAPDFYSGNLPYVIRSFYVGDGIYVIPPHSSINFTEVFHGPEITVIRNGDSSDIKSEYSYIDPYDPSLIYLKVNASAGYQSYNISNLSSNMTFVKLEQGGDLSHPEHDPVRLGGTKAVLGNDPAESHQYWTTPLAEQEATFQVDPSTKKEGNASLKITGKTDSWGNLGVRFDSPGIWNLAGYSSISMWVKCNESATFSMTLVDCYKGSRTFWGIKAGGDSATTCWKRFLINLTEYTSQSPDFVINSVDYIDLFVYSEPKKDLSFWIDDLTVDVTLDLEKFVYKDRVPVDETVVAYFFTFLEDR